MAMIGMIATFDITVEDWGTYMERMELYCEANAVADEKKVAVLLSLMGAKTYVLLHSLLSPEKPADKTFQQIVDILNEHLNPKPLVIAERFRFHKRNQAKGESFSEYIAELCRLSEHCQFGAGLADALRDRLVCENSHDANDCWFKDKECRKCHKKGHIECVCKTDRQRIVVNCFLLKCRKLRREETKRQNI